MENNGPLNFNSIGTVSYHLEDIEFDGPLDLLYSMIKQAKVDIRNIFLTDITKQFVDYVQSMVEKNYDYVSEYVALAAELVELKSYTLLAETESTESYDSFDDYYSSEEMLYLKLETKDAFEQLKIAATELQESETLHRYYAEPRFSEDDYNTIIKNFDINKLISTFAKLLERSEFAKKKAELKSKPKIVIKERFSISDKLKEIANVIVEKKKVSFFTLIDKNFTKLEIINTFLAILELLKRQVAFAYQENDFADIELRYNEEFDVSKLNEEEIKKDVANEYH